jgi:Phosphotransferase enzyme family
VARPGPFAARVKAVAQGEPAVPGEVTLDETTVVPYLARRGILASADGPLPARVAPLGGGVSSVVLLVERGDQRLVVKQPRRRLLVKEEWTANPGRAVTEARALELAGGRNPEAVPPLLDIDAEMCALTVAAAPAGWQSWKDLLLRGIAEPPVGAHLGRLLGEWHLWSSRHREQFSELEDVEVFVQLRIDPYHRTTAARHPALADQFAVAETELLAPSSRYCFVHGDFSPKNVLLGTAPGGAQPGLEQLWVIDFEVAHVGNPVFDVAFLLTHLVLKSLHRPEQADEYRACALEFLENYGQAVVITDESLGLHVGCLLLARVDGKSPAEYLTAEEQVAARRLGSALVTDPVLPLTAWPLRKASPSL